MKSIILACWILSALSTLAQTPEENLAKLGMKLPEIAAPIASYVNAVRVGNVLYLSGKGPRMEDGKYIMGKLGKELTVKEGYDAARLAAINQLAVLKHELKDLTKVKRIVKVSGFVNSDNIFYDHPQVINGFSDLMIQVFGESGKHAGTALGVNALPLNMAVEVELIVEVK